MYLSEINCLLSFRVGDNSPVAGLHSSATSLNLLILSKWLSPLLISSISLLNFKSSSVSVLFSLLFKTGKVLEVGPENFVPAPKIRSLVVKADTAEFSPAMEKEFIRFVRDCFLHRRKLMIKNFSDTHRAKILANADYGTAFAGKRAEQVSPGEFYSLFRFLTEAEDISDKNGNRQLTV